MARRLNSLLDAVVLWRNAFGAVCLWCFLFGFCLIPASLAQHRFDQWTTDNGLPHNAIRAMLQTRDGYLWLTTIDGVARFDGVRFRVFNKANTPALTTNHFAFRALWEDRQGTLWMGTYDRGVIRYRDGHFFALTAEDGLPSNEVIKIDEDEEGTVWILTNGGLAQWKDERLTRVAPAPGSPFNDCLEYPRKNFGVDGRSWLWRMDPSGWQRFAYGRWTPLPLPSHLTDPAKLRVYSMSEDARRNLWYTLADREGEFYLVKDGRLSLLRNVNPNDRSYVCYQDRQGRIWSGSHGGLNGFWKDERFTPLHELATSNVFQALEDREGGLWIATFFEGLYKFREQFITFHRHAGGADYKTPKTAGVMLEDRFGNVWLRSAALARFKDNRFTYFYRPGRSQKAWDWGNVVSALYEDRDGSIWTGTWDGIARFRDGRLSEEKLLSEQIKGRVRAIRRDRAGNLWFGMESGGGLYRLQDGSLTHYATQDGLAGNSVNMIVEDRAGRLLIGTDHGLSRFTGTGFETPIGAEELSSASVNALHEDAAGVMWIGTSQHGLYRLETDQERVKLTRYTTEQGLHGDRVNLILEDDTGFIWMACNLGLTRVRKQQLEDFAAGRVSSVTSTWFGKAHGLVNEENGAFAEPVGYGFKARDGKLWFATREGIAVVNPWEVPFNPTPPPVVIEECVLDRRPAEFQDDLKISPGQESVEIHYTALSLVKSEQARFRYKLEGLDRDWVEAGTRRTAYYSHIPPGSYTFRVLAANSDGVWNTEGQSLPIVVLPPFYRTWWFITLAALAAAGLIWCGYEYRVAQLRREQKAQQTFSRRLIASQEQERKRIAAELHDSLGQNLLVIKNRALLSALAQPDKQTRSQFDDISTSVSHTLEEVRAIAWNLRPSHLDQLGLKTALVAMIERVEASCETRFTCDIDDLDGLLSPADEITVYRIVQESINNVVKHARATVARVAVERHGRRLQITIRDNGQGFGQNGGAQDAEDTTGGGSPFVNPQSAIRNPQSGGFGLTGIAERVSMLGGSHTIHSVPGEGTMVSIRLDLTESNKERSDEE